MYFDKVCSYHVQGRVFFVRKMSMLGGCIYLCSVCLWYGDVYWGSPAFRLVIICTIFACKEVCGALCIGLECIFDLVFRIVDWYVYLKFEEWKVYDRCVIYFW